MAPTTTAHLTGAPYVYELSRRTHQRQLLMERADLVSTTVRLMKSAVRHPGVLGGIPAALQIAAETVTELAAIDRRLSAYDVPPDPDSAAIAAGGVWSEDKTLSQAGARWVPDVPAEVAR